MKNTRKSLFCSIIALLLCFSMLLGTTYAWFTDSVTSVNNIIKAGNLDIAMYWNEDLTGSWKNIENENKLFDYDKWEPGYTEVRYVKIVNEGNLAFRYAMSVLPLGEVGILANVIDVYYVENPTAPIGDRTQLTAPVGTLAQVIAGEFVTSGKMENKGDELIVGIALKMREDAGNEYQGKSVGDAFSIQIVATQLAHENDSFDNTYDENATFPDAPVNEGVTAPVENENGLAKNDVALNGTNASATVPAGTKLEDGASKLTLTVTELNESGANIALGENDETKSLDVHIDGVAATNDKPIVISLGAIAPIGQNSGNFKLYHVENGQSNQMTAVASVAELVAHNQFYYDPATGEVTVAMATFSEVALVADTVNAWEGVVATAFARGTGTEDDPYIIANADQFVYLGDLISNYNENYGDKYYKLVADINLGGEENANEGHIFYPIGYHKVGGEIAPADLDDAPVFDYFDDAGEDYAVSHVSAIADNGTTWYTYGGAFQGTFDGNGHTISNIYQNTWQLKGNYSGNYWNAAMGLFGYVNGGTVKNLTVDNFSSDGEFTPTGVIAAYAVNSTFENIAITNCNPRVYNTGNGGIVGIGGNSSDPDTYALTFTNITIDNTNKISALWGSWDVACGGLVGMFRGAGQVYMTNCHVAAQIDVFNDVCGNYQYYWYRYSGMMIGTNKNMITDTNGYTVPETSKFHAENCTVHFGDWNDYYYCELVANSLASYTHDHQFSRLTQIQNVSEIQDANGNWITTGNYILMNGKTPTETCYHIVNQNGTLTQHLHTDAGEETVNGETVLKENNQRVYLPFNQLFTGYGWGVKHIPVYNGEDYAFDGITILDREVADSVKKFETKFTGDFLYRIGNQNTVSLGSLFKEIDNVKPSVTDSGVWVTVEAIDENSNVSGVFTKDTDTWTNGTLKFSGTGVVKVTIQDYNYCKPTVLYLEVVDATNLTSATGTITGGTFVLLCDVNTSTYVNYWDCTLYGNGFTYSLNGAPTAYNSKQGHGILITKNATLDNLVIVGDVYNSYGAYTNQDYYNSAVDVVGDTVIQNCYISGCSAPISTRANATITNTTLYGGTVANLIIKSGTVTLEDVTTANYDDGRSLVGMGIVIHSEATESAKLILNGTLTQYNFISESKVPTDTYAKNLHTAMFGNSCSKYHFGTSPNRYVNAGIISLTALFNEYDITDNANTGYVGNAVTVSGVNGYVYTQPNTSGSVNNNCPEYKPTTQGAVSPSYSFDHTINEVAKTDGSNDYCYEESGTVYISMDEGDSFDWNTSILTVTKLGNKLDYTVTMNATDYTGKTITFNTAGDYTVTYTYTDGYNSKLNEKGDVTTYEITYTKTVAINVSIIKPTTKHAEFTFGSAGTASTSTTVGNNTYIMPNVTATSSTVGSITVSGTTIYYPIVNAYTSDGATAHSSLNSWYMCYPVFKNVISITDYESAGTGNAVTYGSSTTTMPSGLSLTAYSNYFSQTTAPSGAVSFTSGGADIAFKYQASNSASSTPTTLSNVLIYASPTLSNNARNEMYLLVQYKYQDNAGATYYYYVGYHMPQTTVKNVCVTPDTPVTLADGSQKRIDQVTYEDQLLVWDFFNGEYTVVPSAIIFDHGYDNRRVLNLNFENGITVKVITNHGFYHAQSDSFVFIDEENVESYIGSDFVRMSGDSYDTVKLIGYSVTEEYTGAYSIQTALHNNFMVEGMFSITEPEFDGWFDYFVIGEGMKYDEEKMQADIEKYGLYTYEEFAEYVTYEQFIAFNGPYLKVLVGRGVVTYEQILALIDAYVN